MPSFTDSEAPHVALFPSCGMGHLMPFLRLASALISHGCRVTLICIQPTVSLAESRHLHRFFAAFPQVRPLEFHLLPSHPSTTFTSKDPFVLFFESARRSGHLLSPLLTSSPPLPSLLIVDMMLASSVGSVASTLHIPHYVLFTSSSIMLSLLAYAPSIPPTHLDGKDGYLEIPGLQPLPKSSLHPLLLEPSDIFRTQFTENGRGLLKSNGIIVNTFDEFEQEVLNALRGGKVTPGLPPVFTVGPLTPTGVEYGTAGLEWLDSQPAGSVAYVSFGSRVALSKEQIRELSKGLECSGQRFLWVLKGKMIDRNEEEKDLNELVEENFMEKVKERGVVVKEWVEQEGILRHPAVGGFLSHCGWNSVTESIWNGVPVLCWPQHGDQKVNAATLEKRGVGIWVREWEWGGEGVVVKGEEIGEKMRELMTDQGLKMRAAELKEAARRAVGVGGSSHKSLNSAIEMGLMIDNV